MIKVLKNEFMNIPVKYWATNIENEATKQIINLANLPFAYHHVAIMPDCHSGYGMPIGGVLATEGVVIPYAVGVDIGCGMCAVKTSLKVDQLDSETLKKIMGKIREVIPVGFNHHKEAQDRNLMPIYYTDEELKYGKGIIHKEYHSALTQLGTLGSGNHFIEIQKDKDNNVWIMIHSGSRNLGYRVCNHYHKIAKELNKRWFSTVPSEWELSFLPIETQEAKDYMKEMQYCVDFALANRKLMMDRIIYSIAEILKMKTIFNTVAICSNHIGNKEFMEIEPIINIAHNYAAWENHFGKNIIIHRKGATLAREGTIGIIPGSQGTKSYIVKGLGNKDSFESCSHGAGRLMSRTKATKELNLQEEIKKLNNQGIIHGIRTEKDLDEATGAYKDINEVMNNQKDLVEIITELSPLAVIKG